MESLARVLAVNNSVPHKESRKRLFLYTLVIFSKINKCPIGYEHLACTISMEPLHLLGLAVLDYKEAAAAACGIHESCRAFRTGL